MHTFSIWCVFVKHNLGFMYLYSANVNISKRTTWSGHVSKFIKKIISPFKEQHNQSHVHFSTKNNYPILKNRKKHKTLCFLFHN